MANEEPTAAPVPTTRRPVKKVTLRTKLLAALVALLIAMGTVFGVKAATADDAAPASGVATASAEGLAPHSNAPGGPGSSGQVTSINGTMLNIDSNGTSIAVATDDRTRFSRTRPGATSDLQVGDRVMLTGVVENGVMTVEQVTDGGNRRNEAAAAGSGMPPGAGNGPPPGQGGDEQGASRASGTIKTVDGNRLVVVEADGSELTANLAADVQILVREDIALADVKVGETIRVMGQPGGDGNTPAREISVGDLKGEGPGGPPPNDGQLPPMGTPPSS